MTIVPLVLFAYRRPDLLARCLASLRANRVPLLYAFSDGPRQPEDAPLVDEVREILRAIDWAECIVVERERNFGLGVSVITGTSQVLERYDAVIGVEDDLVLADGAYGYLCAALARYATDLRVTSVTGWSHRRITPVTAVARPFFCGRPMTLAWGTWARVWQGLPDNDATTLLAHARTRGLDVARYGGDVPAEALTEHERNIWGPRWAAYHYVSEGLCLYPPWSMVTHIGYDARASNAPNAPGWEDYPMPAPPLDTIAWPEVREEPGAAALWKRYQDPPRQPPIWRRAFNRLRRLFLWSFR